MPGVTVFMLTMICSPASNPRLEIGSSGTIVNDRGGYPDFTVQNDTLNVQRKTEFLVKTHNLGEMVIFPLRHRFAAASLER
jgi:hypothetical protein